MVKPRKFIFPHYLNKEQREITKNLLEWGIDEHSGNERHRDFGAKYRGVIQQVQDGNVYEMTHNPQRLPREPEDAIRIILRSCIQEKKRFRILIDELEGDRRPPYFVYPSRYADEKDVVLVKPRWAYENLSRQDLDPLGRFSKEECTKQEYFSSWVSTPDDPEIQGLVFEALVASHAIHNVPCFHCYGRNCLQWNGGPQVSWADLVCTHCDSVYEIKSKHDMESIERTNERVLPGGDFRNFHSLCKESRKDGWKRFIVVVSRTTSSTRPTGSRNDQDWCWIVQIAEIDKLIPQLKPSCFANPKKMRPKSLVVKKQPSVFWFRLPYVKVDQKKIVHELLEEDMPGITTQTKVSDEESDEVTDTTTKQEQIEPLDLDALRESLQHEAVDCWEDLLEDDDDEAAGSSESSEAPQPLLP